MTTLIRFSSSLLLVALLTPACSPPVDTQTRLEIARDHEARGDHVTAILELKNLLQNEPDYLPALVMLGRLSLHAGQSADAIRFLRRARELGAPDEELLEPLGLALQAQGDFRGVLEQVDVQKVRPAHRGRLLLVRGQALTQLGDYSAAGDAFRQATSDSSVAAEALAGLARLELVAGRTEAASKLLESALDADPFSVAAYRTQGSLYLAEGKYDDALTAFVRSIEATEIRPGSDELLLARVGMAETQWKLGQKNRALGNVKDLLDAYPWHPLPRYLRALLAYDSGEYTLASEYLREVLKIVPLHHPSQKLLAASQFELGNYANTEIQLDDYLARFPGDIEMRRLQASAQLRLGHSAAAIATLLPALQQDPGDSQVLLLLGRASLHNGDAGGASSYLERAIRLSPDDPAIRVSLIFALITDGQTSRAQQQLAALPRTEQNARTRELLELVLLMRNAENEQAADFAKDLRQATPANLHAMLALAELAEERGDPERAIDWLEMARARNPLAVEPRLLLTRYYHRAGNHQLAHAMATEAVQLRPQQPDTLVALAQEKLDLGRPAQAATLLEEALRTDPESTQALLGLAFAAARLGKFESADDYLARALRGDPNLVARAVRLVLEVADAGKNEQALKLAKRLQLSAENLPDGYSAAGDVHLSQRRFTEALAAYEAAMQFSADPLIAVKSFIAAREAGLKSPSDTLEKWLALHPEDQRIQRILQQAGKTDS